MPRDAYDALLAFIRADQFPRGGLPRLAEAPAPVVTIARDHGAGGEAVAAALAERLGVHCYDREILEAVVAEAKADPALMRVMDEKMPPRSGLFLYATLMGLNDPVSEQQRLLTRVVRAAAFRGAVLVGRGAHLLLRGALRFRVRVVGTDEVCARRLAAPDPDADADRIAHALDEVGLCPRRVRRRHQRPAPVRPHHQHRPLRRHGRGRGPDRHGHEGPRGPGHGVTDTGRNSQ